MGRLLKDCNDGRFLRVEERLFRALGHFLRHDAFASAGIADITCRAKTWKSTFYDHFKDKDDAIQKYNHRYDSDIMSLRNEVINGNISSETAIAKLLYFISKHKNYYSVCLYRQNLIPFSTIVKLFKPVFVRGWSCYGRAKYDLCFRIFCGELFGVIYFWGDAEHFDSAKITEHSIYLSHLAKNATRRLF